VAGLRVDEIADPAWRDLRERGDAGHVTAYGKGGRIRVVLLPATIWHEPWLSRDRGNENRPAPGVARGLSTRIRSWRQPPARGATRAPMGARRVGRCAAQCLTPDGKTWATAPPVNAVVVIGSMFIGSTKIR
jgi:hypothetical protein